MIDKVKCDKRFEGLKEEANSWKTAWKDIQLYVAPSRGFFDEIPNDGKAFNHKALLDSQAVDANIALASGLMSGLTSPSRPWFKLAIANESLMEDASVARWLDDVKREIEYVFQESNIYSALYNVYEELGSFGTAAMAVMEDPIKTVRAKNYTCGEYYLGHNKNGEIDTFAREFWMTVAQVVEEFGYENCSSGIQTMFDNTEKDKWVQIRMLIEVNPNFKEGMLDNRSMKFISYHWEVNGDTKEFLSISGYQEFPIMAPRWSTEKTMTTYGRGPAWQALGDIKMLQKMQLDKLMGLDKSVNPPIQVDASVQGEPNLLAGGVTRFSSTLPNAGVKSVYQVALNIADIDSSIEKTQQKIDKKFFKNVFQSMTDQQRPQMTAREVTEIHDEKLLAVGPILNKLEKELLNPLIDRTYLIMERMGRIPQQPDIISGMDLKVEYVSMLFQAQKSSDTVPIQQVMGVVQNVSALYPEAKDVIDAREAMRQYAQASGVSPRIIRSKEDIQLIDEQAAEAIQQQQQQQNIAQTIAGAKQLSETSLDNNNALRAMIG